MNSKFRSYRTSRVRGSLIQARLPKSKDEAISPFDLYKVALDTRNFELKFFWERCNYFLILNSGLAFAYFRNEVAIYSLPIALLSIVVCFLWFRVALGSKFWASRWEQALFDFESRNISFQELPSDRRFFSSSLIDARNAVARSFKHSAHGGFASWIDSRVLSKPSVTLEMMKLILLFLGVWMFLALYQFYRFIDSWIG